MSRIGKQPVPIPSGVDVKVDNNQIFVGGPKGKLTQGFPQTVSLAIGEGKIVVKPANNDIKTNALHGTIRSLVANMVEGVTKGFSKSLDIQGVGFRAKVEGKVLDMQLGFTHPVRYNIPESITIEVEKNVLVHVRGADKQLVGAVAAEIRRFFPPEPYKGKGIRYVNEHVRRKAGKAVA